VLDLLDQVLVTLLGEATALLSVKVHVVTPHLDGGGAEVCLELGRQVEVKANLMVLEGDEGKRKTGVAVEEEDEGKDDLVGLGVDCALNCGELAPLGLLGVVEVKLRVQAPPTLVVLVDTLATDGKLDVLNGTLGRPHAVGGGEARCGGELHVHVTDKITVAGDGH